MDEQQDFQPRYVAYAKANGMTPSEVLARDKSEWPCGCMCPFILWIGAKWSEFARDFKRDRHQHTPQDHADFDAWLAA